MSVQGLDLSDYQNVSSFHELKDAGIGFVVCKATQGTGNVQDSFADYMSRARSVGMVAGAYHFLEWNVDPVAQAHHFLDVYDPRDGDLPPTLDCEACTVDSATAIIHIASWLRTVEAQLHGQRCLLYMSYSFPADHLAGGNGFSGHPLWIAAYESLEKGFADVTPAAWSPERVKLWQFSDGAGLAPLPGISNPVDRDVFNGSLDDLRAFTLQGVS